MDGITTAAAPHVQEVRSSSRAMWLLCVCLLAPIIQASFGDGFSSLLIACVAVASAIAAEMLIDIKRSGWAGAMDGSSAVTALVLTLMLPSGINPAAAALGAVFAVALVKRGFGGLGSNWLNPAAGAWLFLRFSWPAAFSSALSTSPLSLLGNAVSKGLADPSGSPLALLKIAGWKPSGNDAGVTSWLNDSVLARLGAELPGGYMDLFSLSAGGIIADKAVLLLILATAVLIAVDLVRWELPAAFLVCYVASVRVWGALPYGGALFHGDMLFALLSGGVFLSAFVLAADPATGAKTRLGALLVAAFAGFLAFWLRCWGDDPYGALLAIPAANVVAVALRSLERRLRFTPRKIK